MTAKKLGWKLTKYVTCALLTSARMLVLLIGKEMVQHKQAQTRIEKRTEELAERKAQTYMNEFISIAAHELKTPLTSIKGNIQLAGRRLKNSASIESMKATEAVDLLAETREMLERTDRQVTRLTRLVNTLMETSRINTNIEDLQLQRYELNTLLQEAIQDAHCIPPARAIHINLPARPLLFVMVDVDRIKQVLVHYLSNAHKFSPLNRPIEISLRQNDKTARVCVRDEGSGIPEGEQNRIWESFYRIPHIEVQNGSEVGLGLGLYVSRTIIEQHHGHVGVESAPGEGSIFWFTLPLAGN